MWLLTILAEQIDMEFYNQILTDSGNFALVIFGFAATLFTVLFSFVIVERDKLIELSEKIKSGETNPKLFEKESKVKRRISGYKKLNSYLILALILNLVIYCCSIIVKYLIKSEELKMIFSYVIGSIMVLISLYILVLVCLVIMRYLKITKI